MNYLLKNALIVATALSVVILPIISTVMVFFYLFQNKSKKLMFDTITLSIDSEGFGIVFSPYFFLLIFVTFIISFLLIFLFLLLKRKWIH